MLVSLFSLLTCLSVLAVGCTASLHGPVSRRIVRGFEVDIKSFPYAVFLYFNIVRPSTCGSSLITVRAVVTSAYCMRDMKILDGGIHAFLGASIPMYSKVVRNLTAYRIHPKYNENKGKCDLSVAIFDREVPIMHGIRKIPIYRKSINMKDIMYTVGWGKKWPNVMPDYSDARTLQGSKQMLVSNSQCFNNSKAPNTPVYLCSLPVIGFHYRGDLGNGLVTLKPSMAIVGVVSFMVKDATVYANLKYQRDWVKYSLKQLYGNLPLDKDCC